MFSAVVSGFISGASASVPNPMDSKNKQSPVQKTDAKVQQAAKSQPMGAFIGLNEPIHIEVHLPEHLEPPIDIVDANTQGPQPSVDNALPTDAVC